MSSREIIPYYNAEETNLPNLPNSNTIRICVKLYNNSIVILEIKCTPISKCKRYFYCVSCYQEELSKNLFLNFHFITRLEKALKKSKLKNSFPLLGKFKSKREDFIMKPEEMMKCKMMKYLASSI